ncbi:MAG: hypothetical protein R8J94_00240 [Acidimicrobiia bacterium]|nr:hypothetical protein [Acidimicrobiia bacterium]
MIEVIANSMAVLVGLVLGVSFLSRLLQRAVQVSYANTARVEASQLDDELRRFNND